MTGLEIPSPTGRKLFWNGLPAGSTANYSGNSTSCRTKVLQLPSLCH